jgi:acyl-CoA reductase-like NAD-dependent aldehyde dehydrogenase
MDLLYKLFVENHVVVLKMHPVNEYLGPLIARAFEPLVSGGYLRVVYGDAAEGQYLVHHAGVDEIHMTGSVGVHDRIVWGDTPEEQARRRARREPRVSKRVTSELGCITPVVAVPGDWSAREIAYQAENVATMVFNNASCNCNAAKLLVTWRGWRQRRAFLDAVAGALAALPARKAFYPGAALRYAQFTAHPRASGAAANGGFMSCATIFDVDPAAFGDVVFREEAWCPVIAETALDADDEAAFVGKAVAFCNDRVAGTLSAVVLASPESAKRLGSHLDAGIAAMRYGTVAVNHWVAASYVLAAAPWGAFPGHTLEHVGSGIRFVHNTFMFDRPQKTVLWGPFTMTPKPAWFVTHRRGQVAGRRMARFEAARSVPRFASLAAAALRPN